MVAFDASTLLLSIQPNAPAPLDPSTQAPVTFAAERVEELLQSLEKREEAVIIPTPVLSEILVHAGVAGPQYLSRIQRSPHFKIADFDQRAAVEAAQMTIAAKNSAGGKKSGSTSNWTKIKFDRQIVAIAKVNGASAIYSDDDDIARAAALVGLKVVGLHQLPIPAKQQDLF